MLGTEHPRASGREVEFGGDSPDCRKGAKVAILRAGIGSISTDEWSRYWLVK
jgi:hypothetical protein